MYVSKYLERVDKCDYYCIFYRIFSWVVIMKFQLEVSEDKLLDIHNFCMLHDLNLDIDTMTINLVEIYNDGR